MKKLVIWIFIIFSLFTISITLIQNYEAEKKAKLDHINRKSQLISILCYHHVNCRFPNTINVPGRKFAAQLEALQAAGFSFITLKQLEDYYYKKKPIPLRSALITFDDGNYNNYTDAWPILKAKKIPWSIFVYPSTINKGHRVGSLTWRNLQEMQANGVEVGGHTLDHPNLTRPPRYLRSNKEKDEWYTNELILSRKIIEQSIGVSVNYFAIPFGAVNPEVQQRIVSANYKLVFRVDGKNNDGFTDPQLLDRFIVYSWDSPEKVVAKALQFSL